VTPGLATPLGTGHDAADLIETVPLGRLKALIELARQVPKPTPNS
jgi:hypothetical protein